MYMHILPVIGAPPTEGKDPRRPEANGIHPQNTNLNVVCILAPDASSSLRPCSRTVVELWKLGRLCGCAMILYAG